MLQRKKKKSYFLGNVLNLIFDLEVCLISFQICNYRSIKYLHTLSRLQVIMASFYLKMYSKDKSNLDKLCKLVNKKCGILDITLICTSTHPTSSFHKMGKMQFSINDLNLTSDFGCLHASRYWPGTIYTRFGDLDLKCLHLYDYCQQMHGHMDAQMKVTPLKLIWPEVKFKLFLQLCT